MHRFDHVMAVTVYQVRVQQTWLTEQISRHPTDAVVQKFCCSYFSVFCGSWLVLFCNAII